jgi:hypothetical protein
MPAADVEGDQGGDQADVPAELDRARAAAEEADEQDDLGGLQGEEDEEHRHATWVLRISKYVLMMANEQDPGYVVVGGCGEAALPHQQGPQAEPIQKPPYVANAVAPNTFLLRNSHMPARSWPNPP